MITPVFPEKTDIQSELDIEIMFNFEHEAWHQVNFDLESVTELLIKSLLKDFMNDQYQGEISIILSHDAYLHHLNKTYRHQDKATNVLSFDYGADAFDKGILGDIFLSFETLNQEAMTQQKSFQDHYSHLIIHGLLHLLGYDHEHEEEAEEMEKLEIDYLQKMNISNPYLIK